MITIIKKIIIFIFYPIIKVKRKYKIIPDEQTIQLIKEGYSLSRFGDGEFNWASNSEEIKNNFQDNNINLSIKLKEVLNYDEKKAKKFIIGIPIALANPNQFKEETKLFWKWYMIKNFKMLDKLLPDRVYSNASITRPYMDYKKEDFEIFKRKFETIKEIWNDKEIVIVEGCYTRLGINNDLFDNVKSIKRIICPFKNAFEKYDDIYDSIVKNAQNKLVLIALGPTATILAYDISQKENIQCLDIGHIDIEYEWFLRRLCKKELINGKYSNEAGGIVDDTISDENYNNQIIDVIE